MPLRCLGLFGRSRVFLWLLIILWFISLLLVGHEGFKPSTNGLRVLRTIVSNQQVRKICWQQYRILRPIRSTSWRYVDNTFPWCWTNGLLVHWFSTIPPKVYSVMTHTVTVLNAFLNLRAYLKKFRWPSTCCGRHQLLAVAWLSDFHAQDGQAERITASNAGTAPETPHCCSKQEMLFRAY